MFTKAASPVHPSLTTAGAARVLDDLAHAVALVAGANLLDGEETLLSPDLAHAVAGRAGDGLGPTFSAVSMTSVATGRCRNRNRLCNAGIGLFQADTQVIAQVRARAAPGSFHHRHRRRDP
jgi:hypothetical protein